MGLEGTEICKKHISFLTSFSIVTRLHVTGPLGFSKQRFKVQ